MLNMSKAAAELREIDIPEERVTYGVFSDKPLFKSNYVCFSELSDERARKYIWNTKDDMFVFSLFKHRNFVFERKSNHVKELYDWMLNASPFRSAFLTKDADEAFDLGVAVSVDCPANLAVGGLIFHRMVWDSDYGDMFKIFFHLMDEGFDAPDAFLASGCIRYQAGGNYINCPLANDLHSVFAFHVETAKTFLRFYEGNVVEQQLSHPLRSEKMGWGRVFHVCRDDDDEGLRFAGVLEKNEEEIHTERYEKKVWGEVRVSYRTPAKDLPILASNILKLMKDARYE